MWREREQFGKRIVSSLLAALLVLTPVFSSLGSIEVFAAEHENEEISKAGMAYSYIGKEDIQISVHAENESFAAGEDVHLRVFILNNTQDIVTGGSLRFAAPGIVDGRFCEQITDETEELLSTEDETAETEESAESTEPEQTEESAENTESIDNEDGSADDIESEENIEEWESIEEQTEEELDDIENGEDPEVTSDGKRIDHIVLEPGEIFEAEFFGVVDPDMEKTVNKTIRFSFRAKREEGYVSGRTDFAYNTGIATMLPVEFDNDGELLTNEDNIMYLHTVVNDDELASLFSGPGFGDGSDDLIVIPGTEDPKATDSNASKATDSNASKATSSNASKATDSNAEKEETSHKEGTEESDKTNTGAATENGNEETAEESTVGTENIGANETEESGSVASENTDSADDADSDMTEISGSEAERADSQGEGGEKAESQAEEAVYSEMVLGDNADGDATYVFELDGSYNSGTLKETEEEAEDISTDGAEGSASGESGDNDQGESIESGSEEASDASIESTAGITDSGTEKVTDSAEDEIEEEEEPQETEGFDIKDISYEITTYGVRLRGASVDTQMVRSSNAELVTAVGFRVADKTAPGLYFGTATTVIKYKGKTYRTSTGFQFHVTGEGEVVLTGSIDGAEIEVRGPAESFPDSEELELMVSEVPEDKAEMVAAALEKKAEQEGITVDRMKAVDIKILADGEEKEPTGEVTVTFQQMKLERLDGVEDKEEGASTENIEESAPETEPEEDPSQETQPEEEETDAPVRARRAMARRAAQVDEEETTGAEEDGEAAENAESSESTRDDGLKQNLAVWHLDEAAGELNDMGGDVDENGNVVMKTDHFSIYLVVNVPDAPNGEVKITVEHLAEIDDWGFDKSQVSYSTTKTNIKFDESCEGGVKNYYGSSYLYPGNATEKLVLDEEGNQVSKAEYGKKTVKIYSDDNVTLPNGAGTGLDYSVAVKEWSKVAIEGNYNVKSVTVYNDRYGEEGKKFLEDDSQQVIYLSAQNRIVIEYEQNTGSMVANVAFHDYNVSIQATDKAGEYQQDKKNNGSVVHKGVRTNYVGINNPQLKQGVYEDTKQSLTSPRIGIGIKKGSTDDKINGVQIFHQYGGEHTDYKGDKVQANVNGLQKGIPSESLSMEADDPLHPRISFKAYTDPGFFTPESIETKEKYYDRETGEPVEVSYIAKKYLPNYFLEFNRKGDTYTLSKVLDSNRETVIDNLDYLVARAARWRSSTADPTTKDEERYVYSNLFWPLDEVSYGTGEIKSGSNSQSDGGTGFKDRDPLFGNNFGFGGNDEGANIKHNWFFGMRYDYEFSLGDYIGPMDYYFRGDDDFWLYIDNKLVKDVDLGGIHGAEGAYVNLTQWMKSNGVIKEKYKVDEQGREVLDGNGNKILDRYVPIEGGIETPNKKIKMSVFFIERGGSGSCCYMNFTLPNAEPIPVPKAANKTFTVTKEWLDANNRFGVRPEEIRVQLKQDGEPYGNTVRLNESNKWTYTWKNLPIYKNVLTNEGEYVYTADEVSVPPGYVKSISTPINGNMTITNTLVTKFRVAKWIDNWKITDSDRKEGLDKTDLLEDESIKEDGKVKIDNNGDEFIVKIKRVALEKGLIEQELQKLENPVSQEEQEALIEELGLDQLLDRQRFDTGLILKHAGDREGDYVQQKFSGYIQVIPTKDEYTYNLPAEFDVNEIIPKEYDKSDIFLTILSSNGTPSNATESTSVKIENNSKVLLYPGAEAVILVHNKFEHKDYFHHDYGVRNDFNGNSNKPPIPPANIPSDNSNLELVTTGILKKADDEEELNQDVRLV